MSETGPIILAQSASGEVYEAMLGASAGMHQAFCDKNDVELRSYRKVLRGSHPWQACYNRIEILHDLVSSGFEGWFIHLDADAIIRHPEFDIRRFLGKRAEWALIAAASAPGAKRWDINDGVFFLNLRHPQSSAIVRRWHLAFHTHVTNDMLRSAIEPWTAADGTPFPDDQHLLQMELMRDNVLVDALLVEDAMLINHRGARFIRQFLRSHGSQEERLAWIKETALSYFGDITA